MSGPTATREPVLVAGCGSIGTRHLRNLKALGVGPLLALDADRERTYRAAATVGATPIESIDVAPSLRAAFICTPTNGHLEPARAALRRGAHLFIEKPIAATMDGVPELIAEADRLRKTI